MSEYFTVAMIADVTVIHFERGELSIEEAEGLKEELYALVIPKRKRFVIDLQHCGFVSSIALGVFVCLTARVHQNDGKIVICGLTNGVKSLFVITKLNRLFDLYESQKEAVAALQKSG